MNNRRIGKHVLPLWISGLLFYVLGMSCAWAVGIQAEPKISDQEKAQAIPEEVDEQVKDQWRNNRYRLPEGSQQSSVPVNDEVQPFGSDLFSGGFRGMRADGLNPQYRLVPGDQVTVRLWGAVEMQRVLPVDAQGNIFLPSVGPVQVQGTTNSGLNKTVKEAIQAVYPDNVQVYTNLQGVQPVAVFVTGYVEHPGRYAGTPTDSLLYFLDQAGGIDPDLGSYRHIRVLRQGQEVIEADLYDFILNGGLAQVQFQDGDTIVVDERGGSVVVSGDVQRPYRYEFDGAQISGADLLKLARLKPDVSHVLLRGPRLKGPVSAYYDLAQFAEVSVQRGDELLFSADRRDNTIVVQVEGSHFGPSRYALPRDARLHELLDAVAVPPSLTDVHNISLKRLSVAKRQKASLMDSLRRLETTYLGAPSATADEASIRVQEAKLIQEFVAKASQTEPTGRMVVSHHGVVGDIRLRDGDVITVPEYSDSLLISGEVLIPQSVIYQEDMGVQDYITAAGGFSQHADEERILVVRQNGEVRAADQVGLKPGDEILVLPAVPTKNLQLATSITQILYQIAVATKVAVDL